MFCLSHHGTYWVQWSTIFASPRSPWEWEAVLLSYIPISKGSLDASYHLSCGWHRFFSNITKPKNSDFLRDELPNEDSCVRHRQKGMQWDHDSATYFMAGMGPSSPANPISSPAMQSVVPKTILTGSLPSRNVSSNIQPWRPLVGALNSRKWPRSRSDRHNCKK